MKSECNSVELTLPPPQGEGEPLIEDRLIAGLAPPWQRSRREWLTTSGCAGQAS